MAVEQYYNVIINIANTIDEKITEEEQSIKEEEERKQSIKEEEEQILNFILNQPDDGKSIIFDIMEDIIDNPLLMNALVNINNMLENNSLNNYIVVHNIIDNEEYENIDTNYIKSQVKNILSRIIILLYYTIKFLIILNMISEQSCILDEIPLSICLREIGCVEIGCVEIEGVNIDQIYDIYHDFKTHLKVIICDYLLDVQEYNHELMIKYIVSLSALYECNEDHEWFKTIIIDCVNEWLNTNDYRYDVLFTFICDVIVEHKHWSQDINNMLSQAVNDDKISYEDMFYDELHEYNNEEQETDIKKYITDIIPNYYTPVLSYIYLLDT